MTIQSPQQMLAGRYELRELIGRGGMAEVHLGYDTRLSRIVAIKLLRSDIAGDPTFQARFRREATSAAALNHPAIVAVYDSGEEELTQPDGTRRAVPFIVMEYVEGHTVRELLGEGEAVPISEAVEITTGVLDALEYSHRAGIVHRDIKPGNIMLTQAGAVKVMDFGIARAVEDSAATVTQTHAVVGTAQYLSPEQARGEVVDARSDLYSTGCLLYELLTGQPPFTGDSAVAIAYQHVREIPKPPSSIAADIPDSLDRVVLKALAKNRDDRYQDAAHMRADLLAAARGLDVAAPATDSWAATTVLPQEAEAAAAAPSPQEQTPAEEEEQPRRRWWVWALVLVALIALGTLLGLYASGVLGRGPEPTPTPSATAVAVPSVSGMSESDAQSAIENLGLVYEKGDDVNSDTIDAGLAVSSDPGEGTSVLLGSTVTVHFSSGSAMVSVPDVSGQSQADARTAITNAGLSVGDVTTEDSTEVASGAVIRTDPVAGTSVERGSSVSLVVSSGKTTVPNVIGMTQDEAQSAITAAGLTYNSSTVEGTTDDESKDDQYIVTAVDPSEGNSVDANSSVTLTITHYTYKAPATATPEPTSDTVTPAAEPTTNDTAGDNG
ncbi:MULTISPECIES: Stk1 family PASTA domain-containing Ser/Thr kinase [unclassified Actinomyces]|uniref:Stk1 family PASTA domain-containing Ser/Thr kinase n=2 Tax=Actinomyces TaxID=1654 RepID=UPI000D59C881|nr:MULTISPECIES: Stk1 family PASTA domain-containing Ser/Thr kinase [unclassified Actinomyces]RAX19107.1 Stk1 family PASTA domain-containing Ser/Thr kinase [Actinomyces sp. Z3]RAX23512.1 Stk1 family PASTA domain-containing Ser/Thr kinase [Actinomyces sp. Z5]